METPIKARVLQAIARARSEERTFLERLSDESRAEAGTPQRWSAKDVLGHITSWREQLLLRLAAAAQGQASHQEPENLDETNAGFFESHRLQSWPDLLAEAENIYARVVSAIESLPDEILTDPARVPWLQGQPLWRNVLGNSVLHPVEHLSQYYIDRGDLAAASALQTSQVNAMAREFEGTNFASVAVYNLACFYAKTGQKREAIETLGRALSGDPSLIPWSKQDTDLDSLRDDPAYQTLYAAPAAS